MHARTHTSHNARPPARHMRRWRAFYAGARETTDGPLASSLASRHTEACMHVAAWLAQRCEETGRRRTRRRRRRRRMGYRTNKAICREGSLYCRAGMRAASVISIPKRAGARAQIDCRRASNRRGGFGLRLTARIHSVVLEGFRSEEAREKMDAAAAKTKRTEVVRQACNFFFSLDLCSGRRGV